MVSDFKVILLLGSMVILLLVISEFLPQVFAISRDEINAIKSEIDGLEKEIILLDEKISEQKITRNSLESASAAKKEEWRKAKEIEGKSWTGQENTNKKQVEYKQSVQGVKEGYAKYILLLQEKSNLVKRIKELVPQVKTLEKQQQMENRPNLTGLAKIIGVDISQSCITLIKNNLKSDCPSYLDLKSLDSSRQEISGFFKTKNGYYSRDTPSLKSSWRFYDHDPTPRIIIDPPQGMSERIRLITIESNLDNFLLSESKIMKQNYVILNGTSPPDNWGNYTNYSKLDKQSVQVWDNTANRVIFHDRYVDEKCKKAVISADKWLVLLPDTINFMRNNCDENFTSFDNKEIVVQNLTSHDITTTQKWKDDQRLKWIKENCLKVYGSCK